MGRKLESITIKMECVPYTPSVTSLYSYIQVNKKYSSVRSCISLHLSVPLNEHLSQSVRE